jgi:hypothetical protein
VHNMGMRANNHPGTPAPERRVQFSRGHWRRDEGAVRSTGWWESVTVTWSPAPAPEHRPALLHRALAATWDMIAPSVAEALTTSARRVLDRRVGRRTALPPSRRVLPAARELPRAGDGSR